MHIVSGLFRSTPTILKLFNSPTRLNMSNTAGELKRFALEYVYVSDILEKRGPYRAKHLELLENLVKEGKLLGAGPYSPPTGGLFLFRDETSASAEQFVADDPYVSAGLVTSHTIKEWTKVLGDPNL